jgi:hypothetical protein
MGEVVPGFGCWVKVLERDLFDLSATIPLEAEYITDTAEYGCETTW